jgi:hypothetical protein
LAYVTRDLLCVAWDVNGYIAGSPKGTPGHMWQLIGSPLRIPVPAAVKSIAVGSPHALASARPLEDLPFKQFSGLSASEFQC